MNEKSFYSTVPGFHLRHARSIEELVCCFPVISVLRPGLKDRSDWIERATDMAVDGYRVLAAWDGERAVAVAGYRTMVNLIHTRFLYVDDLVTVPDWRGRGLGSALLGQLSEIGLEEGCRRLVLDTAAANINARRFYKREGLIDAAVGFVKQLGVAA